MENLNIEFNPDNSIEGLSNSPKFGSNQAINMNSHVTNDFYMKGRRVQAKKLSFTDPTIIFF